MPKLDLRGYMIEGDPYDVDFYFDLFGGLSVVTLVINLLVSRKPRKHFAG